jgi:hypothetical protein
MARAARDPSDPAAKHRNAAVGEYCLYSSADLDACDLLRRRFGMIGFLAFVGIYTIISAVWKAAEVILYGESEVSFIHSVVGLILAYAIYLNIS